MDGRFTWTIREIVADPRYRQFAREMTEQGKQVVPDSFPWSMMGWTDREIGESDLRYESGDVLGEAWHPWVDDMIGVVRAQEKLVVTWWHWWPGLQQIPQRPIVLAEASDPPEPGTREAVVAELNPCRPGAQRLLF